MIFIDDDCLIAEHELYDLGYLVNSAVPSKMSSDSYKCGVCQELYDDPRMLKCLHSFCMKCLSKASNEQGSEIILKCPTCDRTTTLPYGGVFALSKDLRKSYEAKVARYREKVDNLLADEIEVRCERCVEENMSVSFCCQCCLLLCGPCCTDHRRSKATLSHKLVHAPKDAPTSENEETDYCGSQQVQSFDPAMVKPEAQLCSMHQDEVLKFYCETCDCLVCRDCTVVEHSGHSYDRVEKIVDKVRRKLTSLLEEVTQTKERIETAISSITDVKKEFDSKKLSIDESIASAFCELEHAMSKRKEALLAQSANLSGNKVDRLSGQVEELDRLKNDVIHVSMVMHAAIETYSIVEMLSVSSVLAARLKELLSHLSKLSLDPCETKPTPVFVSLDPKSICSKLTEFGIITSGCCPRESTASLQIPRAIIGRERRVIITARDQEGKLYLHGGEKVQASIVVDGRSKQLEVMDNADGTYVTRFVPESCGELKLSISIQGQAIKGSPFCLVVRKPRNYRTLLYYEKCLTLPGTAWMVGVSERKEIFVGVGGAHCISIFDSDGYHLRSVGTKGSGRRQFSSPSGVVAHGDCMYVSEFFNHRIQKLSILGDYKLTFGKHGSGDGELNGPRGLCFDPVSELLFVSDSGNNRLSAFNIDGTFAYHIVGGSGDKSLVDNPWGLAFDPWGNLHVVCYGAHCVKVFSTVGKYLMQYGQGKVIGPAGISIDEEGYSFVSEYSGHQYRVVVFNAEHEIVHTIQNFTSPSGLALDREGKLYVADHGNSRVLKY